MTARSLLLLIPLLSLLTACEQLGVESAAQINQRADEEGKAIGGACRHAGRALEDCYRMNSRAPKAAIFTGWRDMDGYMRENKIDEVPPQAREASPASKNKKPLAAEEPPAEKPASTETKATEKPAPAEPKAADKHGSATGAVNSGRRTL